MAKKLWRITAKKDCNKVEGMIVEIMKESK